MESTEITLKRVLSLALTLKRSEQLRLISDLALTLAEEFSALESQTTGQPRSNQGASANPTPQSDEV